VQHSFTVFAVFNLRTGSKDENAEEEVFRNFNRVCNTLKSMYFFHLGNGPFCGRYFGGDLASDATDPDQAKPWSPETPGLFRSALPHDHDGRDMHLRMNIFCLRSSCKVSRSDPDTAAQMTDVHPTLPSALGIQESGSGLQCRYRHRWCVVPSLPFRQSSGI
jgi:hypothetical protein